MADENGHHEQQAGAGAATGRSARHQLTPEGEPAMGDSAQHVPLARRRLLHRAAAAGLVAAAAAAEQLARPAPAQAGTDGDVVLGQSNTETTTTTISNTASGFGAFLAGATGNGTGVEGISASGAGVFGSSSTGHGVLGVSNTETGVVGFSKSGTGVAGLYSGGGAGRSPRTQTGVFGFSDSGTGVSGQGTNGATGVEGDSDSGVGVIGSSTSHWGVSAKSASDTALQAQSMGGVAVVAVATDTGVYGQSGPTDGFALTRDGLRGFTDSGAAAGVRGENAAAGNGVSGTTSSAGPGGSAAVDGTNSGTGPGVRGAGGIGVLAQATGSRATALKVHGPAVFSRSGTLTVAAGKSSATVTGVALTAASLVLATLQQHAIGVSVQAAVPDVSGNSFTVYLSKAPSASAKVAWFVVN